MADGLFNPSRLYEVLAAQGLLPEWSKIGRRGEYDPVTNRMVAPEEKAGTLAHELTHASQVNLLFPTASALMEKKKTNRLTKQEQQFLDAMSKIMLYGDYKPEDINKTFKINDLYYKGKTEAEKKDTGYNDYRTSLVERQAFGVGNMTKPDDVLDQGGLHFDPTMATEFSILMGLYESLPDDVKKQTSQTRKQRIQRERETKPNKFSTYPFIETTDIFSDPFAPTIK